MTPSARRGIPCPECHAVAIRVGLAILRQARTVAAERGISLDEARADAAREAILILRRALP